MTIVKKLRRHLRLQRLVSVLMIIISASLSVSIIAEALIGFSFGELVLVMVSVATLLTVIYYLAGGFSNPPINEIVRYLDRTYPLFEDSSGLYHQEKKNSLEELQLQRIDRKISSSKEQIKLPKKKLIRSAIMSVLLVSAAFLGGYFISHSSVTSGISGSLQREVPEDVTQQPLPEIPVIESVQITITPPAYTGIKSRVEETGNVSAAVMSNLAWSVEISGEDVEAAIIFNDREKVSLQPSGNRYAAAIKADHRQIYRISASTRDTTVYSEYYSINVMEDRPPQFRVSLPTQMRTMLTEQDRQTEMSVEVLDDYGIREVHLNATLARGSGESVRFREQRFEFDRVSGLGSERVEADIKLHADSLEMTPGDELYIYVSASDNHPETQTGRSETYMLVVEDTTRSQPLMAGNIVIDLMPEDFRSQRQIIVDTEKLLSEEDSMSDEQFRVRSRRIGRDQEMLMLEFGQYMSMEDETSSAGGGGVDAGDDHARHDHGGEGEAELDGEGQEESQSSAASDIPDEFFHDHGSPEMNTLFAESPRALLRRALSEMFRASQYLQTDRPGEALAYEYRALEFLQEAQQADRRYVRRAGLDGIPIPVDEKRLTGTIDDFANPENSYQSNRSLTPLQTIEKKLRGSVNISTDEMEEFSRAVRQAEISEGDKLFLLNRFERISTTGESDDNRQQLLAKLSEINSNLQSNPSPARVPSLGNLSGGE